MPQPTPYEPDFTFWSIEAGQSWFPGHQLDHEFANLDITLTEILDNLELIQRDDGEVANKTIGRDQLKDDLWLTIQALSAQNAQEVLDAIDALSLLKADINSPTFTGDPKAPTPSPGDNDTSIATSAFVTAAVVAGIATRQPLDADLTALAALATTGFAARTAADTWALRSLTAPAAGFTITNPAGVAGNPTFVLANDLAALEALASNGFAERTGVDTWQITGFTGTGSVVRASAPTLTGTTVISINTAVTRLDYLQLTPTDWGSNKPYLAFTKGMAPETWEIVLWDGTDSNGIVNVITGTGNLQNNGNNVWHLGNLAQPAQLNVEDQTLAGGARVTEKDLGTISSGTVTPDPGDRPLQKYTNGGAHTLAPGSNVGAYLLTIVNNGSAGAITTSGWTKVAGDSFTTTNGHKFRCHASITGDGSVLIVQAMQ
jgi:hypothetical protein